MLKTELSVIIMLILLFDGELPKFASIVLAFLAGLSLKTGSELWKRTFTVRKFLIRLLFIFGLSVGMMFVYQSWDIKFPIVITIIFIVLFSDLIVMLVERYGELLIRRYFKKFDNE